MKILIDLQAAQTESRLRGIGRFALGLLNELIATRPAKVQIDIFLSAHLQDSALQIRRQFADKLGHEHIHLWQGVAPVCWSDVNTHEAQLNRELFIEAVNQIQADYFLTMSLFEGYNEEAYTLLDPQRITAKSIVIGHDLIPLLWPKLYLDINSDYKAFYSNKIELLKKADYWLANSNATAEEMIEQLELPKEQVVNISAGVDLNRLQFNGSQQSPDCFLAKWSISQPYLIYSGGADPRKNLSNLLQAFCQVKKAIPETPSYQLVLVGHFSSEQLHQLQQQVKHLKIEHDVVFTGYVSDQELAALYNYAKLFVFPSLHEGFGLPVLEAMANGLPVLAGNNSALVEVVGNPNALFDAQDPQSIADKIIQLLTESTLQEQLVQHAHRQVKKFSWKNSAEKTWKALMNFEALSEKTKLPQHSPIPEKKSRLAMVCPLPPDKTGIAGYSIQMIKGLSLYYQITVVTPTINPEKNWNDLQLPVENTQWLTQNFDQFDDILYQFGNAPYHKEMLPLLEQVPGVIVLHDFFLSGLYFYLEVMDSTQCWSNQLYNSHGYTPLIKRLQASDMTEWDKIKMDYPCNLEVLQNALGVIVHSQYAVTLAEKWYPQQNTFTSWQKIPLVREKFQKPKNKLDKESGEHWVCSFGILAKTKLNHRLIEEWAQSTLSKTKKNKLIFVGESTHPQYHQKLQDLINHYQIHEQVMITGWLDNEQFNQYLSHADIAVQLRSQSRGESSAAVLDCMNAGITTIVNANGSMAELDSDTVVMLNDDFSRGALSEALQKCHQNPEFAQTIAHNGQQLVHQMHSLEASAKATHRALQLFKHSPKRHIDNALQSMASNVTTDHLENQLLAALTHNFPASPALKVLYLDVTASFSTQRHTGIERVANEIVKALILNPPLGIRIEPVVLDVIDDSYWYRHAHSSVLQLFAIQYRSLKELPIEPKNGDHLLILDMSGERLVQASRSGLFKKLQATGVHCSSIVYDLLPLQMPHFFPEGASGGFQTWLEQVAQLDFVATISQAVKNDFEAWLLKQSLDYKVPKVSPFNLGVSLPDFDWQSQEAVSCNGASSQPIFIMVGTLEPRKGHLQVFETFQALWQQGYNAKLIVIGKLGWQDLPENAQRTIPQIKQMAAQMQVVHPGFEWIEDCDDQALATIYQQANVLIAASEGEGFGLPIIEAAHYGCRILARKLTVFAEVSQKYHIENIAWFSDDNGVPPLQQAIIREINHFLTHQNTKAKPASMDTSWQQSAAQLLDGIGIESEFQS